MTQINLGSEIAMSIVNLFVVKQNLLWVATGGVSILLNGADYAHGADLVVNNPAVPGVHEFQCCFINSVNTSGSSGSIWMIFQFEAEEYVCLCFHIFTAILCCKMSAQYDMIILTILQIIIAFAELPTCDLPESKYFIHKGIFSGKCSFSSNKSLSLDLTEAVTALCCFSFDMGGLNS